MSITRQIATSRNTRVLSPIIEAYSVGLSTAQVDLTARGMGPFRLFFKHSSEPETEYELIADWAHTASVPLFGLSQGETYDVRAVNRNGKTFDVELHMPFQTRHPSANSSFVSRLGCQDREGRIIACTKIDGASVVIRRSSDGGRTWEDIRSVWHAWHLYYHNGYIYGTTTAAPALDFKDRLWRVPNATGQSGDPQVVMGPMFRHPNYSLGTVTFPWCFEPRGPYWVVGASSNYDPYNAWPGGWNETDYGNRIYYTSNNWASWNEMKAPPVPVAGTPVFPNQLYTRRTLAVCWNPVAEKYFVSHGDGRWCNYAVSGDLQTWRLIAEGRRFLKADKSPSGGSLGVTWLPDGSWLAGCGDLVGGHIAKFWPDGKWRVVLEPGPLGATMIWDIWAYDDGEVWATGTRDGSPTNWGIIWVSLDWGETWRIVHKAPNFIFQPRWIAGCHETRRLHGPWVFVDRMPEQPETPGWVWRRFK